MRRAIPLLALLAFAAPAQAVPPRGPGGGPALQGTPYLFRDAGRTVRLVFRTGEALPRRYDGLLGGGAQIAGREASIGAVEGADDDGTHCYTAAVRFRARVGRRYAVRIAMRRDDDVPAEARPELRRERAGDARGKPLDC